MGTARLSLLNAGDSQARSDGALATLGGGTEQYWSRPVFVDGYALGRVGRGGTAVYTQRG